MMPAVPHEIDKSKAHADRVMISVTGYQDQNSGTRWYTKAGKSTENGGSSQRE
jgi:hypothetical protein